MKAVNPPLLVKMVADDLGINLNNVDIPDLDLGVVAIPPSGLETPNAGMAFLEYFSRKIPDQVLLFLASTALSQLSFEEDVSVEAYLAEEASPLVSYILGDVVRYIADLNDAQEEQAAEEAALKKAAEEAAASANTGDEPPAGEPLPEGGQDVFQDTQDGAAVDLTSNSAPEAQDLGGDLLDADADEAVVGDVETSSQPVEDSDQPKEPETETQGVDTAPVASTVAPAAEVPAAEAPDAEAPAPDADAAPAESQSTAAPGDSQESAALDGGNAQPAGDSA